LRRSGRFMVMVSSPVLRFWRTISFALMCRAFLVVVGWDWIPAHPVIACDKREAFAQGSVPTKQSIFLDAARWIASLRSQ
jgi:hypothetical protein